MTKQLKNKQYNDVLYIYINRFLAKKTTKEFGFCTNYFSRVFLISKITIKNIIYFFKTKNYSLYQPRLKNKIWLFVLSLNNVKALLFLKKNYLKQSEFVSFYSNIEKNIPDDFPYHISVSQNYPIVWNITWIISYLQIILSSSKKYKVFYIKYPHLFYVAYLAKKASSRLIQFHHPKMIIFSNDINIQSRFLNLEARRQNIYTVYVQHASISDIFPPLNFHLALLEGQYSVDTYKNKNTIVKIIGQPKFEEYKAKRKLISKIQIVGIAFNSIDDLEDVRVLSYYLNNKGFSVHLRPHPRETRKEFFNWNFISRFSTKEEDVFSFLHGIDILIASDSSIHIECVLLNIPSVYYNLNRKLFFDYYAYVKNNVVDFADNLNALYTKILQYNKKDNSLIYKKAQYYCYSTDKEIISTKLAIDAIDFLLSTIVNSKIDMDYE